MRSERMQILTMFDDRRIDLVEAERLLTLVGGRDRFLTWTLWAVVQVVVASFFPYNQHWNEALRAALHSAQSPEVLHHVQIFINRFLGELL